MKAPGWQSSRWYEVEHPLNGWGVPRKYGDDLRTLVDLE